MGFGDWLSSVFSSGAPAPRTAPAQSGSDDGLTFEVEGKEPETDSLGRVIVRLDAGKQLEFGVFELGTDEDFSRFLLGKPKDDLVERSVRVRVSRTQKRDKTIYEVSKPDGGVFGEIAYADSEMAGQLFGYLDQALPQISPALAGKNLIYDVSLRVEGEWYEDPEEDSGWMGNIDSLVIRVKDPAGIDIRGA